MSHPRSDQEIEVGSDQLAMYESQGWRVTNPARRAPAKKTSAHPSTPAPTATDKE